jgi:hypothetical protein
MCFSCESCRKMLDSTTLCERTEGDTVRIFCKACYAKNFGPTGYGYGAGAGTLAYAQRDGAPAAPEPAPAARGGFVAEPAVKPSIFAKGAVAHVRLARQARGTMHT